MTARKRSKSPQLAGEMVAQTGGRGTVQRAPSSTSGASSTPGGGHRRGGHARRRPVRREDWARISDGLGTLEAALSGTGLAEAVRLAAAAAAAPLRPPVVHRHSTSGAMTVVGPAASGGDCGSPPPPSSMPTGPTNPPPSPPPPAAPTRGLPPPPPSGTVGRRALAPAVTVHSGVERQSTTITIGTIGFSHRNTIINFF